MAVSDRRSCFQVHWRSESAATGRTQERIRMTETGAHHSEIGTRQRMIGAVPEKREKMEKPPQNIQDGFLNTVRKEKLVCHGLSVKWCQTHRSHPQF